MERSSLMREAPVMRCCLTLVGMVTTKGRVVQCWCGNSWSVGGNVAGTVLRGNDKEFPQEKLKTGPDLIP